MRITESQLRKIIKKVLNEEVSGISARDPVYNEIVKWMNSNVSADDDIDRAAYELVKTIKAAAAGIRKRKSLSNQSK